MKITKIILSLLLMSSMFFISCGQKDSDIKAAVEEKLKTNTDMAGPMTVAVNDGKLLTDNKEHEETVVDVAFSNDGKMLASTSDDCTIKLWNVKDGALIRTMKVPEHVQAVAFSPDDKLLMTGGRDKTLIGEFVQTIFGDSEFNKGVSARLWDVNTGTLLQTFTQHSNDVMDIAFSHDGKWIATASADKTVELWKLKK